MSFVVFTNDDYIIGTGVNSINSDAVDPEPTPTPPWILATGAWNDNGVWDDNATWNDGV